MEAAHAVLDRWGDLFQDNIISETAAWKYLQKYPKRFPQITLPPFEQVCASLARSGNSFVRLVGVHGSHYRATSVAGTALHEVSE